MLVRFTKQIRSLLIKFIIRRLSELYGKPGEIIGIRQWFDY